MSNYIADQLFDAVDKILDSKLATAGFDKTIRAVVKEVLDESKGKYSIEYEGSKGVAWAIGSVKYDVNDEVYVMVPGQIGQREKYILSKVMETESSPSGNIINFDDFITIGRATIDWSKEENKLFIDLDALEPDPVIPYRKFVDISFKNDDQKDEIASLLNTMSNFITFGADFKFNMPNFYGNYGLKLTVESYTGEKYELTLDINDMSNNPYNYSDFSQQKKIFQIKDIYIHNINSFQFFIDHLEDEDIGTFQENCGIQNIFLYSAELKNNLENKISCEISRSDSQVELKILYDQEYSSSTYAIIQDLQVIKNSLSHSYIGRLFYDMNTNQFSYDNDNYCKEISYDDFSNQDNEYNYLTIEPSSLFPSDEDWKSFSLKAKFSFYTSDSNEDDIIDIFSNILQWHRDPEDKVELVNENGITYSNFTNNPIRELELLNDLPFLNYTLQEIWNNEQIMQSTELIPIQIKENNFIHYAGAAYTDLSFKITLRPEDDQQYFLFNYELAEEQTISEKRLYFFVKVFYTNGESSEIFLLDQTNNEDSDKTQLSLEKPFNYSIVETLLKAKYSNQIKVANKIQKLVIELKYSCQKTGAQPQDKIITEKNKVILYSISNNNSGNSKQYLINKNIVNKITSGDESDGNFSCGGGNIYYIGDNYESTINLMSNYQFFSKDNIGNYTVSFIKKNSISLQELFNCDPNNRTVDYLTVFYERIINSYYHGGGNLTNHSNITFNILWISDNDDKVYDEDSSSNIENMIYAATQSDGNYYNTDSTFRICIPYCLQVNVNQSKCEVLVYDFDLDVVQTPSEKGSDKYIQRSLIQKMIDTISNNQDNITYQFISSQDSLSADSLFNSFFRQQYDYYQLWELEKELILINDDSVIKRNLSKNLSKGMFKQMPSSIGSHIPTGENMIPCAFIGNNVDLIKFTEKEIACIEFSEK